jgi:hypothetical protein
MANLDIDHALTYASHQAHIHSFEMQNPLNVTASTHRVNSTRVGVASVASFFVNLRSDS